MRTVIKYTWIPLVIAIYAFRLTLLPIFTDETNYIDWGWRATHLPGHIFYSLYDAKQPLMMWFFGLSQSIFADPLFAGRIVSVVFGVLTGAGVYCLAKKLFDKRIAVLSLIIYLTSHYFLFFNRQALVDGGMSTIFIWTAYVLFAWEKLNTKKALVLGILFGLGYLTKSNSLLVIITSSIVLFYKHREEIFDNFGKSMLVGFVMFVSAVLINLPMLTHPWFAQYIHLSTQYTWSIKELLKFPGKEWLDNLSATLSILVWFITPATLIFSILGIKSSRKYLLAFWILMPLAMQVIMAKFLVSRYLVSYLPAIVIFASYFLLKIKNKTLKITLGALVFLPNLYLIYFLYTSPPDYFYQLKRVTNYSYEGGYVTAEASGYNLLEARKYFDSILQKDGPFMLGIAVFSGNPEAGLLVYYRDHPEITVSYLDAMLFGKNLEGIECLKSDKIVYLATRDPNGAGLNKYFENVHVVTNEYNDSKIYVFKLKSECQGKTIDLSVNK